MEEKYKAFEEFEASEDYRDSLAFDKYFGNQGTLWVAFSEGWNASQRLKNANPGPMKHLYKALTGLFARGTRD